MRRLCPCCSYSITYRPFARSLSTLLSDIMRFCVNKSNIALTAVSRMGAPFPSSLFVLVPSVAMLSQPQYKGLYDMLSVWDERESNPPVCKRYTLLLLCLSAQPSSHLWKVQDSNLRYPRFQSPPIASLGVFGFCAFVHSANLPYKNLADG